MARFMALFFATMCFVPSALFGQDLSAVADTPATMGDWQAFIAALGGVKGLGGLGFVALLVQGVMLSLRSGYLPVSGRQKILVVSLLSLVGGVVALKMSGLGWSSAILHSTTLAAIQVFLSELNKYMFKPEEKTAASDASAKGK